MIESDSIKIKNWLVDLNLSDNQLSFIPADTFDSLLKLEILNIENNMIKDIEIIFSSIFIRVNETFNKSFSELEVGKEFENENRNQ